jgi:hypothetical protein
LDTSDVDARFEVVAAAHQGQIVNIRKGVPDFGVQRRSAKTIERTRIHVKRSSAVGPIMKVGAIVTKLQFVDCERGEKMLQLQHKVRRYMRDYVMGAKSIGRIIYVRVIDVVARV